MHATPSRTARATLLALSCATLAACGTVDGASRRITDAITPYRVEVVQGNFVSREQVELLRPGMSRAQVRDILGTPLVTSLFHGDRWDFVFTLRRQGIEVQTRRLSVFFQGDTLARFEGDEMPPEAEFVAHLDSRRKGDKVPVLEAPEETLRKFTPAGAPEAAAPEPAAPAASATPVTYPPLEAAR